MFLSILKSCLIFNAGNFSSNIKRREELFGTDEVGDIQPKQHLFYRLANMGIYFKGRILVCEGRNYRRLKCAPKGYRIMVTKRT
jgi:hypothetical protein